MTSGCVGICPVSICIKEFNCGRLVRQRKVKVKVTLVQALTFCTGRTAHRGSRGVALPFHDHGTRRGEGSASRHGRSLLPGKNRYPLRRRLGGPQGRFGQVRKISLPQGFDPRTVQTVASHYTDWAIAAHVWTITSWKFIKVGFHSSLFQPAL